MSWQLQEHVRIHTLKCSATYISQRRFSAWTIFEWCIDIVLILPVKADGFPVFFSSHFSSQHHGLTHFEGFSVTCCHQPDSKNWLALDFKPSRCCKTLQLCWDIRWFLILKWEVKSKQIPSSVLTFMCLDSLQHKSWWQLMRLRGSPLRQWVMQLDTKVASTTLELPKLRHSADAAGGRAGNADWN